MRSQVGCHSVDEDLLCLCQLPPPGGTHVVTRNSCRDDIRTFLRQQVNNDGSAPALHAPRILFLLLQD